METILKFTIDSLLFGYENPKGNIEQVLFAKKMADKEGITNFNSLAKLNFADETVNKALAGTASLNETLVLGYEGWSKSIFHLCIRSGRTAIRMATGSFPNREIVIYDDYRNVILLNKLTDKQIKDTFDFLWNNMDMIQPKSGFMFTED
ncbi:hypothetical protein ACI513_03590 [Chryseobacterium sp. M5]|uniref:hypothetical protein n=1 Tax=Chryseobacterium sp. M5 TaxID=3379128 RepID=UPI0038571CAB